MIATEGSAMDGPHPKLAVVVLHWGDENMTKDAVDSLSVASADMSIFLVDQGVELNLQLGPNDHLIPATQNIGFCAGNNRALHEVLRGSFDFVLLLNNDAVVEPRAVERLVHALASNPRAAAAAPTVLFDRPVGAIWWAGGRYLEKEGRTRHLRRSALFVRPDDDDRVESTTFIPGCAVLLRVGDLRSIGLLDERYFMYWEDADWCVRALSAGRELLYVPSAIVIHRVGGSRDVPSPLRLYYFLRNWLLFIRTHTPQRWKVRAWWGVTDWLMREVVKVLIRYRVDQLAYVRMLARALFDNRRRKYGQLERAGDA